MRINRFLARSGLASRRNAEEFIKAGQISVNGKIVSDLATEIDPKSDTVKLNGQVVTLAVKQYLILNKPKGYVTTKKDPHAEKTVFDLLPDDNSLFPVGRLDKDSQGLLFITNDGFFAQNITHPKNKIEKEYLVWTKQPVTDEQIEKLKKGVGLSDGMATAVEVKKLDADQLKIIITEGKNRQIRRMIAKVDNKVKDLKRIRIGNIKLEVPLGKIRKLTKEEIKDYV